MSLDYVGCDSWTPPTQEAIDLLKQLDGFHFWGGYIGGAGVYENKPWPQEAWDLLKANGIAPLPIWVPLQNCSEYAPDQADQAMAAVAKAGMHGVVAVDAEAAMRTAASHQTWLDSFVSTVTAAGWLCVEYNGVDYLAPGAFAWLVEWGNHDETPVSGEAIQYGPYTLHDAKGGDVASLDSDTADSSFPFATWVDGTPVVATGATPTSTPAPADPSTYTVKTGDNLTEIAAKYGVTETELYNENKSAIGDNPDLIHPGLILNIPANVVVPNPPVPAPVPLPAVPIPPVVVDVPGPASVKTYTVVEGDSLWSISAKEYGNGQLWGHIYDANVDVIGSNPNLIHIGQKLTIPAL